MHVSLFKNSGGCCADSLVFIMMDMREYSFKSAVFARAFAFCATTLSVVAIAFYLSAIVFFNPATVLLYTVMMYVAIVMPFVKAAIIFFILAMTLYFVETMQIILAMMFVGIAMTKVILVINQVDIKMRKTEDFATKTHSLEPWCLGAFVAKKK